MPDELIQVADRKNIQGSNNGARFCIREFRFSEDYSRAFQLWEGIEKGIHVGPSDAPDEIDKKLERDPDLFLVAEADGDLIGTVIGGYDGRRGFIYHLAVLSRRIADRE